MIRNLTVACILACAPLAVLAQDTPPPPAALVADSVEVTRDRVLIATGNVEIFQGDTRLRAQGVTYDARKGSLILTGPILLQDGPDIVVVADQAELSKDLQDGLLIGARVVMNEQLQLAAVEMNRVGGRYTQLYKTAVTSCHVCDSGKAPLWQIRAKRVVHDQQEQQLYFDRAQFRIRNVPVFYLPRLRLPDPTLERATGFLIPSLRTTSQLGTGIIVPYFIKLGDHRDLTLSPYWSARTDTLNFRYRQAFKTGRISFEGAYTRDDLRPGEDRGYLFGEGRFDLERGYVLSFALETTSDDAYLIDYGITDADRLTSELALTRARRDKYIRAAVINFRTLREGEVNKTLPTNVIEATYEQRFFPNRLGGEFRIAANAHGHFRQSGDPNDTNLDGIADGRDVLRLNLEADWHRQWTFRSGLQADFGIGFAADLFHIKQDALFTDPDSDIVPRTSLTLRYPMVRQSRNGRQLLEPVLQIGATGGSNLNIPNEESTRVEFDEGNLLSLSRFPRPDRRERSATAAIGINWSHFGNEGWDSHLTFGQVIRRRANTDFSDTSGLAGTHSDFLLAGQIKSKGGFSVTGRALFNEKFDVSKAELRGDWAGQRSSFGTSYVWLTADTAEDRPTAVSELTFDGTYKLSNVWTANANWRYDLVDDRAASAGLGIQYVNECVTVDFSVKRRYTSSTSVEPSTNLGFTISLRGFSASNGTERYANSCETKTR
ncbi:LPS assembly protein LptD [Ascidiaceihabitans sp.]|uniref:LPS-assembly protein LptD n=1 Tax=Ascidiaceihabitans sp. TaxID=1872644 RepID=UPI00329725E1